MCFPPDIRNSCSLLRINSSSNNNHHNNRLTWCSRLCNSNSNNSNNNNNNSSFRVGKVISIFRRLRRIRFHLKASSSSNNSLLGMVGSLDMRRCTRRRLGITSRKHLGSTLLIHRSICSNEECKLLHYKCKRNVHVIPMRSSEVILNLHINHH